MIRNVQFKKDDIVVHSYDQLIFNICTKHAQGYTSVIGKIKKD